MLQKIFAADLGYCTVYNAYFMHILEVHKIRHLADFLFYVFEIIVV